MPAIPRLLAQAALELRDGAASAALLGLEPDELEQLADRLLRAASGAPERAMASLAPLAQLFGDERDVWASIAPAFVELMDALRTGP